MAKPGEDKVHSAATVSVTAAKTTHPPAKTAKDDLPPDVRGFDTVQEEQITRSAEIEAMGVEAWKAAHDDRNK